MSLVELAYKKIVRPIVFRKSSEDAEIGHEWGIRQMERLQRFPLGLLAAGFMFDYSHPMLETLVMGRTFSNPLGLAAGFDKYCRVYWGAVPAMGFGFVEVGGITPLRQEGNERPRMWRSEECRAICNAMGFNNPGQDAAYHELLFHRSPIPVMINVGKGRDTPLDRAGEDYCSVIEKLWLVVDYITINVSSPNTKDLRQLQTSDYLKHLMTTVQAKNRELSCLYQRPQKKIGVKVSPDETDKQLADIVSSAIANEFDYITCVNTTVERAPLVLANTNFPKDRGGISGWPLRNKALRVLWALHKEVRGRIALISVGGIDNAEELYLRITNGADLCQVLTVLPFEGPDFAKRTLRGLVRLLERDGFQSVTQAVGSALK